MSKCLYCWTGGMVVAIFRLFVSPKKRALNKDEHSGFKVKAYEISDKQQNFRVKKMWNFSLLNKSIELKNHF